MLDVKVIAVVIMAAGGKGCVLLFDRYDEVRSARCGRNA
jgi:hypothetical protein